MKTDRPQTTPCYEVAAIDDGQERRFTLRFGQAMMHYTTMCLSLAEATALCRESKVNDPWGQYVVVERRPA